MKGALSRASTVLATALSLANALPSQEPPPKQPTQQIAIIGAGAAGSSAAYYLQEYAKQHELLGISVNITLFEKTHRIGGRTLTINAYDDPSQPIELGASIFIEKNHILYGALQKFNLSKRIPDEDSDPKLGIWDGDEFVFTVSERDSFWWTALKVIYKYGIMAPRRTQQLMESTINNFLKLYEQPNFPFRSLTQRAYELGLVDVTGVTGEQLLKANNIDDLYAHDIIQASTRVNYASNLVRIHGLDTMVSMAPEGAMAVQGGNWQIFHKMAEASGATILLNTSVTSIGFSSEPNYYSGDRKYVLRARTTASASTDDEYPVTFDNVIIANPYQFSKISAEEGVIQQHIDEIPYVQLHVTIFASPYQYSPAFFGLTDSKDVPGGVLTTLAKSDGPTSGVNGAGKAGFFSVTTLRTAINPTTQKREFIYKIFSPEKVTPDFLTRLFGVEVPDSFTAKPDEKESRSPITWYHPHVFYSYPQALPRVTFQDPIIGPGLFYTSGIDSFISTMETNALMGKNVAALLIDDILKASKESCGAGKEFHEDTLLDHLESDQQISQKVMEDL
ncbi:putative prenylcysteine oxidase [Triangularia verruculosa]|uniref:Prenylcysteine oxidase n=1 Tax=Triangularia verruculosa TaxID=2587418 RepID=A0AAN7ARN7_9PEZI|nr:putative prenylcysteine oxidase [Triangularia verruculosa]